MDDIVATFSYDIHALRLEYKTTCDALEHWRGGDPTEQEFLIWKKAVSYTHLTLPTKA